MSYFQVIILKLQSKLLIKAYLLCAIGLSLIMSMILIFGVQSRDDKLYIFIFMGSVSLLCVVGMILEIKHYIYFYDQRIVIKNRLKSYEILLADVRKIEIFEPVWENARYLSMYKNKIILITDDVNIKFVYYTFRKILLKNEIKNLFGTNYMGKLISKKADEKNRIIYEFVGSALLSLFSLVGIITFSIEYSWYLYLSIAIFLVGGYLSYRYFSKLMKKK